MTEFNADAFYKIGAFLGQLRQTLHINITAGTTFKGLEDGSEVFNKLRYIEQECRKVGLIQSTKLATRFLQRLATGETIPFREILTETEGLKRLIDGEMEEELFLYVPSARKEAYQQNKPFFGALVAKKFPSASLDVEEAGKCFACGRFTASVMHCMRVLEHGLRALCLVLTVPFGEGTWHRALERIEKRIGVLDSQVKQKAAWKKKRQFYTEAVKEFTHFKDAWRNHAAHGHEHYDDERAEKIIGHTRSFMQVLATRLKERQPKA